MQAMSSARANSSLRATAMKSRMSRMVCTPSARMDGCKSAHKLSGLIAGLAASSVLLCGHAEARDKIAEFAASGFLFKDTVEVVALEDPEVSGVTLYISDFKRSLVDKLSKDFFNEPSQASLTCTSNGPVVIKDLEKVKGPEGHEVFSEKKGLNMFQDKTLRVRRVYDAQANNIVYVSFSTRLMESKEQTAGRYRTSICAVPVTSIAAPAVAAQ